jgi:hypothetical protein
MRVYKGSGGVRFSIHDFAVGDKCTDSLYTFHNAIRVDIEAIVCLAQNTFLPFSLATTLI